MLGFYREYSAVLQKPKAVRPKAKFRCVLVKFFEKSAVKHFIEKPILHNFLNWSTTFCPRSYDEIFFTIVLSNFFKIESQVVASCYFQYFVCKYFANVSTSGQGKKGFCTSGVTKMLPSCILGTAIVTNFPKICVCTI